MARDPHLAANCFINFFLPISRIAETATVHIGSLLRFLTIADEWNHVNRLIDDTITTCFCGFSIQCQMFIHRRLLAKICAWALRSRTLTKVLAPVHVRIIPTPRIFYPRFLFISRRINIPELFSQPWHS